MLRLISALFFCILTPSLLQAQGFTATAKKKQQRTQQQAMDKALANALKNTSGAISSEQEHISDQYSNIVAADGIVQNAVITKDNCTPHNKNLAQLHDVAVYGRDNRKTLSSKRGEFGLVICISPSTKEVTQGSATIIDVGAGSYGDVIVTAEHVLRNEKTGEVEDCYYHPKASREKKFFKAINITNPEFGGLYESKKRVGTDKNGQPIYDYDEGKDWAVATLSKKLSNSPGYGAMPIITDMTDEEVIKAQNNGAKAILVAYNSDTKKMSYSSNCKVFKHTESTRTSSYNGIYGSNCDGKAGASGGPLVLKNKAEGINGIIGLYSGNLFDNRFYSEDVPDGVNFNPNEATNMIVKFYGNQKLIDAIQKAKQQTNAP